MLTLIVPYGLPKYLRGHSTRIFYRWDGSLAFQAGITTYPLTTRDQVEIPVRGWLDQGKPYRFDGNEVDHFDFDGRIFPSQIEANYYGLSLHTKYGAHLFIPNEGITVTSSSVPAAYPYDMVIWTRTKTLDTGETVRYVAIFGRSRTERNETVRVEYTVARPEIETEVRYGYANIIYRIRSYVTEPGLKPEAYVQDGISKVEEWASNTPFPKNSSQWNNLSSPFTLSVDVDRLGTRAKHYIRRDRIHRYARDLAWMIADDLERSAVDDLVHGQRRFDGNALNWVSKLTSWGGELSALLELADNFNPKNVAGMWLSTRFGSRLEYKTSLDMLDSVWDTFLTIRKQSKYIGYQTSRYRKTIVTPYGTDLVYTSRLVCSNESLSGVMSSIKGLMDWGYWPSLVNTFDLIPFSFVFDWLTNVSQILTNIDDMIYQQYLSVALYERSVKTEIPYSLLGDQDHGSESTVIRYYGRRGGTKLPAIRPLEGWDPETPSLVNALDGVSLLIQLFG